MTSPWHVSVLIPARNEEELLPRCLRSVLAAREQLPAAVSCDVVVAVDRSTDRTFEIAMSMIADLGVGEVVESHAGVVGHARALAAAVALRRNSRSHEGWWLANTDADCEVPVDWLTKQVELARCGIQAVAGIVDVDSFDGHGLFVEERFRASYTIHGDGSHPHVHGANLGIRADAYLDAGGWGQLATAEDHDLWNRLGRMDCNRLSTARVIVVTSGRRIGRAPLGFAGALAAHNGRAA